VSGQLRRVECVRAFRPLEVGGIRRTAIAWTTAGSVAAVIELVRAGKLSCRGFLKQEDVPLTAFLDTPTGRLFTRFDPAS
jgi:saccharopine dehydrogenase-like NADP-dependent oxidoreductase